MSKPYRIIFAGTPEFAATILQALIESPHEICAVYTQPDRPAGRGQKITASAVKALAQSNGLPVCQPHSLKDLAAQQALAELQADLMLVVAYGLILPAAVLTATRLGCINVHASLLPRWRGAAPIQRAILAGDSMTGVSIMQMDKGLDTGPVWRMADCPILPSDNAQTLHDKLAEIGAQALLATLEDLAAGAKDPVAQQDELSCYAHKINKTEAAIDWSQSAQQICRQIRAFNPWPICFSSFEGNSLRIWQAESLTIDSKGMPGEIMHTGKDGIVVATGKGALRLLTIQLPGGKPLACSELLNAHKNLFGIGKLLS
jgi:methionyl-tRNA formyltransferase